MFNLNIGLKNTQETVAYFQDWPEISAVKLCLKQSLQVVTKSIFDSSLYLIQ